MKELSNVSKIIVVAIVAAILIIVLIVYGGGAKSQTPIGLTTVTSTGATVTATAPANTDTQTSSQNQAAVTKSPIIPAKSPAVTPPTIKMVTPVAGDVWAIGSQNLISWNKAADFSGAISLLNATTKAQVGVILPETGSNQTSYTWNTTGIYLDRTNPDEKDVVPGTYIIEVSFDGNGLKPIMSPTFTITN